MIITDDIKYVGVNDHDIDLFEGQYIVKNGMAYNSYLIADEKIAVMDTVDVRFCGEWLVNVEKMLSSREPDYLIVQHMEPDHSANIAAFMQKYSRAAVVATAKAFAMMKQFFGTDFAERRIVAKEGSTLSLGRHTLTFVTAPMVHWPEVMVTYDSCDKVLFSADGFGKFGALDAEEDWTDEARRYYIGIVGKYGAQVQNLLKKASKLDIRMICPLHGPVLKDNLAYYLNLYKIWSSYEAETDGIVIAYTSVYGHTKKAVERLAELLKAGGCPQVAVHDLARCDMAKAVEDAFRFSKLVLATTTYNAGIFPSMREFLSHLTERKFQNRTVALVENGSWAPMAAKVMKELLEPCRNLTFAEPVVHIKSALDEESSGQTAALAKELTKDYAAQSGAAANEKDLTAERCADCGTDGILIHGITEARVSADAETMAHDHDPEHVKPKPQGEAKKGFVCKICGYIYEGDTLPEDFVCPLCKHGAADFEPAV